MTAIKHFDFIPSGHPQLNLKPPPVTQRDIDFAYVYPNLLRALGEDKLLVIDP
jgi:ABC-type taurine transport system substrate-binding protein